MDTLENQLNFLLKCVKKIKQLPDTKNIPIKNIKNLPILTYQLNEIKKQTIQLTELVSYLHKFLQMEELELQKLCNPIKKRSFDVGGGNFIELDYVDNIKDIPDNFHFYYVESIKEVVLKINNNYVNFKLEKVLNQTDIQNRSFNRLENCIYKNSCINSNCNFYHNPIDFPHKYMTSRHFYPTHGIKSCPTFGSKDEIAEQKNKVKFSDVLDVLQKSCFLILAGGFLTS